MRAADEADSSSGGGALSLIICPTDGRPTHAIDARALCETILSVSRYGLVFPPPTHLVLIDSVEDIVTPTSRKIDRRRCTAIASATAPAGVSAPASAHMHVSIAAPLFGIVGELHNSLDDKLHAKREGLPPAPTPTADGTATARAALVGVLVQMIGHACVTIASKDDANGHIVDASTELPTLGLPSVALMALMRLINEHAAPLLARPLNLSDAYRNVSLGSLAAALTMTPEEELGEQDAPLCPPSGMQLSPLVERRLMGASTLPPARSPSELIVCGASLTLPGHAHSIEALWELLNDGRNGIMLQHDWSVGEWPASITSAGFVSDTHLFDHAAFLLSPHEVDLMDEQQTMMLEGAFLATADAGFSTKELSGRRMAVVVACNHADAEIEFYQEERSSIPPNLRVSKAVRAAFHAQTMHAPARDLTRWRPGTPLL